MAPSRTVEEQPARPAQQDEAREEQAPAQRRALVPRVDEDRPRRDRDHAERDEAPQRGRAEEPADRAARFEAGHDVGQEDDRERREPGGDPDRLQAEAPRALHEVADARRLAAREQRRHPMDPGQRRAQEDREHDGGGPQRRDEQHRQDTEREQRVRGHEAQRVEVEIRRCLARGLRDGHVRRGIRHAQPFTPDAAMPSTK
jgi:hypothetical protein